MGMRRRNFIKSIGPVAIWLPSARRPDRVDTENRSAEHGNALKRSCRASIVARYLAFCIAILPCSSVAHAQSVAFINPGKFDETFWVTARKPCSRRTASLGMTFEVQYAEREPLKTFAIAREMTARPAAKRPEYIVITDDSAVADQLLQIIDAAAVKSFLAYSSIPIDQRVDDGWPRSKYKGWLRSLEARAQDAGYLTAHALIERGKKERAFGRDGKLHMLAIAGDHSTSSSIKRNDGMQRAVTGDTKP